MVGMKSSATVQQMQPFASSTIFSSGQLASAQDFRISPSTPSLPNSLTSTASFLPLALAIKCRISVVLPEPRKPVMTVTGILASEVTLRPPIKTRSGEGAPATAFERFQAASARARCHRMPRHRRRRRPQRRARFFRQPSVHIGPAARRAERDRATLIAGGKTFDRDHIDAWWRADPNDGLMQQRTRRGLTFRNRLAGPAGDADVKRDGHRPSPKNRTLSAGVGDAADDPERHGFALRRGTPRPPVQETIRWQVSRLAERDFSLDPRLPDPKVSGDWGSLR